MLITELKAKETILSLVGEKTFIINCHGCKEIHFPEHEADALQKELQEAGKVTGILTVDYICNSENSTLRLEKHKAGDQEGLCCLRYLRSARLSGRDSSGARLRPVRRVLSEHHRRHLPPHRLLQEPCERPVRRFQERQVRSRSQYGLRLGAHLQTPGEAGPSGCSQVPCSGTQLRYRYRGVQVRPLDKIFVIRSKR